MKRVRLILLSLASLAFFSCVEDPDNPNPEKKADFLVVNNLEQDHEVSVSPEGLSSTFKISTDGKWTAVVQENTSWVSLGERVTSGKLSWKLPYTALPNDTQYPRSSVVTVTSDSLSCRITITQSAPDPLVLNKLPGLYGLDGGNVTLGGRRQSATIRYGKKLCYRIMDPATLTVHILGDIPEDASAGSTVTLRYKKVVQGMLETMETIDGVEVVRNSQGMMWLRKSDTVYFIIDK